MQYYYTALSTYILIHQHGVSWQIFGQDMAHSSTVQYPSVASKIFCRGYCLLAFLTSADELLTKKLGGLLSTQGEQK